jgi:hypothetical protein
MSEGHQGMQPQNEKSNMSLQLSPKVLSETADSAWQSPAALLDAAGQLNSMLARLKSCIAVNLGL